ncbi:MAG: MBL fold metallo-hydrolase [Myxococcota bacterium]|nr:MBL fold metallo-hydrolase [Myxococcota bacterium]
MMTRPKQSPDSNHAERPAPEIHLVGHACVLITWGDVRLLCDPWLTGTAFLNGWAHLVESTESITSLNPTHIWLSHEHPDHFSPRDLLAVDPAKRGQIEVLYQTTKDRKVASFLQVKGFAVTELTTGEEYALAEGFAVVCGCVGADSWLGIRAGDTHILNLNDCITGQDILISDPDQLPSDVLDEIGRHCPRPDVLLTQFSYSNWVGNPADFHLHRLQAETKLNQVRQQIRHLQPKTVVPFASFVWFCHEENLYQNACMNTLDHVVPVIVDEGVEPVVLYPGDHWVVNTPLDNTEAQARWRRVYAGISDRAPMRDTPVQIDTLKTLFDSYRDRIAAKNNWAAITDLKRRGWLPPAHIYLEDLSQGVSFDLVDGLMPSSVARSHCDIQLGSTSLAYLLKHDWGRGTLMVNARFSANCEGLHRFLAQTQIAYANNVGLTYPDTLDESVIRESPSYVAFFAKQALRMQHDSDASKTLTVGSKPDI